MTVLPGKEVHIELPPKMGEELSNALEEAVDNAAEQKVSRYHKQASTWFQSFILLLVLALFGMKALMGGKKKAEARMVTANAAAEQESMQRQFSEARMQMMQAQVEPHFLFNALASVEHLIETDPPRASAMQRSLIRYLRAVLPQMRDSAPASDGTGLGLATIRERLKLLHGDAAYLRIKANQPSGVVAIIEVPYQLAEGVQEWKRQPSSATGVTWCS